MIFVTVVLTAMVSQAKVMDIIQSRSLKELMGPLAERENQYLNRKKCEVELADGFIPVHCYKWINQKVMSLSQKKIMTDWLDQSCAQAILQEQQSPEYALNEFNVLSAACRRALKVWSEEWLYKMGRESKEKFFKKMMR